MQEIEAHPAAVFRRQSDGVDHLRISRVEVIEPDPNGGSATVSTAYTYNSLD